MNDSGTMRRSPLDSQRQTDLPRPLTAGAALLLTAALIGLALVLFYESPKRAMVTSSASPFSTDAFSAIAHLEKAGLRVAEERGRTYVGLHAAAAIGGFDRAALLANRAAADASIDEALAHIEAVVGRGPLAVTRVRATRHRVAALRDDVDRALAAPPGERDVSLASRWFRATNELVDGLYQSARLVGLWWNGEAPAPRSLVALHLAAWRISDIAGRERAIIGAAIASGEPTTRSQHNSLAVFRNRLQTDWHRLEQAAADPVLKQTLSKEIEHARNALFQELPRARRQVLAAGLRRETYPYTPTQWFSMASRIISTVMALRWRPALQAGPANLPVGVRWSVIPTSGPGRAGDA